MEFKTITERKLSAKHYRPPGRPLVSAKRFLLPAVMPWGRSLLMAEARAGPAGLSTASAALRGPNHPEVTRDRIRAGEFRGPGRRTRAGSPWSGG